MGFWEKGTHEHPLLLPYDLGKGSEVQRRHPASCGPGPASQPAQTKLMDKQRGAGAQQPPRLQSQPQGWGHRELQPQMEPNESRQMGGRQGRSLGGMRRIRRQAASRAGPGRLMGLASNLSPATHPRQVIDLSEPRTSHPQGSWRRWSLSSDHHDPSSSRHEQEDLSHHRYCTFPTDQARQ